MANEKQEPLKKVGNPGGRGVLRLANPDGRGGQRNLGIQVEGGIGSQKNVAICGGGFFLE